MARRYGRAGHERVARDLRRRILTGDLLPRRRQLPPEAELKKLYGASCNTVRDAIGWLATNGLVDTRPGHGTFVKDRLTLVITLSPDPETGLGGEGPSGAHRGQGTGPKIEV